MIVEALSDSSQVIMEFMFSSFPSFGQLHKTEFKFQLISSKIFLLKMQT